MLTGELTCQVHLAATVKGLMQDGGAVLVVREIPPNTRVEHYCTCRLLAQFHVENVGQDKDEPFPLFRSLSKENA